ncbi:MAG: 7-carboxy-7-deazaguanine synthase QueE [Anaerolineae bacterium]|nr:7-carboxy-7-deazaguanine synthase QueE [Anaerolineae bacterium]
MSEHLYPVNDLYTCVQGEGVQTGVAMVLLRLHGCAVGCPWCDTKETWEFAPENQVDTLAAALGANPRYVYLSATAIADYIQANHPGPQWVLVTGGEPAQYGLRPLVTAIHNIGLKAAIETSGTEVGHVDAGFDWVCVSPKLNMPGGKAIQPAALAVADEIKHVVGRQQDIDELDELLTPALKPDVHICLQPVSVSAKATALCLEVVQQRGWRLSVQMHKYIGVK